MNLKKSYSLEFIALLSGAVVMVLELVGARTLAPYYGTSINTWTVLIGIVLGSLSIGYWCGGKLADKHASHEDLARILLLAGLNLIGVALCKDLVIYEIGKISFLGLVWGSVFATLILFSLPNILLGMISPYVVKLKLKSLHQSGANIGTLYAISTVGSIVGTFGAGFVLIPLLGVSRIIILMGIVLLLSSLFLSPTRLSFLKLFLIVCSFVLFYGFIRYEPFARKAGIIDIDSSYGRIFVFNTIHPITHKPSTYLITGAFGYQSGKSGNSIPSYISSSDLIIKSLAINRKKMLVIGGGAFSLPDYFLNNYPSLHVDVIEIDPEIARLANIYFNHKENNRLITHIADGRIFINSSKSNYDIIFNDAYMDIYPPYNLSTQEAIQKVYQLLNEEGLYLTNVISPLEGKNSRLFQSIYKTYSSVFSHVLVFPLQVGIKKEEIQNILLVGVKTQNLDFKKKKYVIPLHQWSGAVPINIPIFTDDYAPVENNLLSITTQKPLYPMSRYFLETSIATSKKFIVSIIKSL